MTKPKTYREIFEAVKEPWGKLALENCDKPDRVAHRQDTYKCLSGAFLWEPSPQGGDFWNHLYMHEVADDFIRLDLKEDAQRTDIVAQQPT